MARSEQRAGGAAAEDWRNAECAAVDDAARDEADSAQAVNRLLLHNDAELSRDAALASAEDGARKAEASAAAAQTVAFARWGRHWAPASVLALELFPLEHGDHVPGAS